jgi:hypothetical protein
METLRVLKFTMRKFQYRKNTRTAELSGDNLLIITKYTENEDDLSTGQPQEYIRAWTVMLGQWANHFLSNSGVYWVSRLAQAVLHLDHRENRPGDSLAKRIMYLLFVVPADIAHVNSSRKLIVGDLLQQIGELPAPEARGQNWAARTRKALELALETLEETGLVASVEWPDGFGPADTPRVTGWAARWLNARIWITGVEAREKMLAAPTPPMPKRIAPPAQHGAGKNACLEAGHHRAVPVIDALAIWRKLESLHWSQRTLAKHIGCSPAYLSCVMNGRRKASPEMAQRLRDFLATSDEKLRGD